MDINILIVENQRYEFNRIFDLLKETYKNIYPEKEDFIRVMSYVHVSINKRYLFEYRKMALDYISEIVNGESSITKSKPIDLIIMDHKLGGAHDCHTGIDLANYLNIHNIENPIPVIFLSKTPLNNKDVLEGTDVYDNDDGFDLANNESKRMGYEQHYKKKYHDSSAWIHKGYDNDGLDSYFFKRYFKKYILPEINLLNKNQKILNKLIWLKNNIDYPEKRNGWSKNFLT